MKKHKKSKQEVLPSLDDISFEMDKIRRKLLGLSSLYSKMATDESGDLDIDEGAIGMGEILTECAKQLEEFEILIREHTVGVD